MLRRGTARQCLRGAGSSAAPFSSAAAGGFTLLFFGRLQFISQTVLGICKH